MNKTFRLVGMALIAIMICMNFAACSSEDDNKEEPIIPSQPAIEDFNQTDMNFTEKAGEQTFSFTTNAAWTVSVNAILLTSNKFEIEQKGGTFTVEVKANVNYTATIGEACKEWITEGSNARALSTTTKTYSVAANEDSEKREGTITFTDGTLSETVHIYQSGGDIILLSKNEYNVDAAGEEITVELRSNCEYEVEMPDADWIHTVSTRAMSSHTLHYTIDANTTSDSREAKINYRNRERDIVETLTIVQAQKDAIILGKKEVTVKADGETIEVNISAYVEYEVEMPNIDWITTATTRGLPKHTLYYKVVMNEGEDSRSAKITFTNKSTGLKEVLTVNQEGFRPAFITINVPTAGELHNIIGRSFKALKLTGYLNGTDVKTLRGMKKVLEYLDISEISIVSGGDYYYEDGSVFSTIKFYTKDNEISDYMFLGFDAIKEILLPNNVTTIGNSAFGNCSSLTSIKIGNSVTTIGNSAFGNCSSLTSIDIPNSVTTIGISAFTGCI